MREGKIILIILYVGGFSGKQLLNEGTQGPQKQKLYQNPKRVTLTLDEFSRDLTALARDEKLDPVNGRDKEIKRVIQILVRRTKNNPGS
jgi:ATP-dependent Clp protease ATP-binding subunit ClpC